MREQARDFRSGGIGEAFELVQVRFDVQPGVGALARRADENRALDRRREGDQFARNGRGS
ncbi:MAG: hypothetical protein ACT4P7_04175 [Gemmatimonadaceae bacterium]